MADAGATVNNTEAPNRVDGAAGVTVQQGNPPADDNVHEVNHPEDPENVLADPILEDGDDEPPVKKSRFNLEEEHVPREEDEGKWTLPEELAEFFAGYTKKHYTDKDMKNFMSLYPAPSNLHCVP